MNAVEYTYRIFAINVAGDSEWTSATALTLANRPGVPAAPIAANRPRSGSGTLVLVPLPINWDAPAFNGGAEILSYEYRYQVVDSNAWTGWTRTDTKTTIEVEIAAS